MTYTLESNRFQQYKMLVLEYSIFLCLTKAQWLWIGMLSISYRRQLITFMETIGTGRARLIVSNRNTSGCKTNILGSRELIRTNILSLNYSRKIVNISNKYRNCRMNVLLLISIIRRLFIIITSCNNSWITPINSYRIWTIKSKC